MATTITTAGELQNMSNDLSEDYILGNDIALSGEWTPVGTQANKFTGSFDGQGYTISGLTITDDPPEYGAGLFGFCQGGTIENVNITGFSITVDMDREVGIGAIAAQMRSGIVRDCYVQGTITRSGTVNHPSGWQGLLLGSIVDSQVSDCHAEGTINWSATAQIYYGIGGLIGYALRSSSTTSVRNCYAVATLNVDQGPNKAGGLIGSVTGSVTIANDFAIANFTGALDTDEVGGFIGTLAAVSLPSCAAWFKDDTADNAIAWWTSGSGPRELITYNVRDGGGGSYIDDDETWFYDMTNAFYQCGAGWGDDWYAWPDDYPQLTEPPFIPRIKYIIKDVYET